MNVTEARNALLELCQQYFTNASVVFAKQSYMVKPVKPLVTLQFSTTTRPLNPPEKMIDGLPVRFYPTVMMAQIDLFTGGKQREVSSGMTAVMENTAVNDMLMFADFLNSEYVIRYCHDRDMAIITSGSVQDITNLINDTSYEYRAMLEVELRFTDVAIGTSGMMAVSNFTTASGEKATPQTIQDDGVVQTVFNNTGQSGTSSVAVEKVQVKESSSGGGNEKIAVQTSGYFTDVRIGRE